MHNNILNVEHIFKCLKYIGTLAEYSLVFKIIFLQKQALQTKVFIKWNSQDLAKSIITNENKNFKKSGENFGFKNFESIF
jgi:hypothetical protein